MLRRLSTYFRQNVIGFLALFIAVGTGGAYAADTIGSTDIIDGQVKSVDIGNGEVNSADVKDQSLTTFDVSTFLGADIVDGSLTGHDVGTYSGTVAVSDIGMLPANSCGYGHLNLPITPNATDHIVVTPQYLSTAYSVNYTAEARNTIAYVKACNPTSAPQVGDATFNVLVIPQ